MASTSKIGFFFYCLFSLVFCLNGHEVLNSFKIVRDKHDTFKNLQCEKSKNCSKERCEKYGANCADDECDRCRCKDGKNTFLAHTGNCTKDEMVIPESGKNQYIIFTHIHVGTTLIRSPMGKKMIGCTLQRAWPETFTR